MEMALHRKLEPTRRAGMKKSRPRHVAITSDDTPTLQAARRVWAAGHYDEAVAHFDEAVRRHPANVRALVDAARAHGFRYDYARCEELTQRLLRLSPNRAETHLWAGETYRMIALADEATACFERACVLGATVRSLVELATLYERQHRLDEAADLASRALAKEPRHGPGCLLAAGIERRRGDDGKAESMLRDLIALPPADPDVAAEAWADLAAIYDQRGQFDDAWPAILESKAILLARDRVEREAADVVLGRFRRMVDTIDASYFERWAAAVPTSPPRRLALLTGFPRSGTTLLEQVLDGHAQLVSSEERDVFSREVFPALGHGAALDTPVEEMLDGVSAERLRSQRETYFRTMEAMLREPIGERVHLDKNPAMNLMLPAMLRVLPEMKIIVALRDPRDVLVSCFLRYLPLNPVSVCFLTIQRAAERYALDMQAWLKLRAMIRAPWIEVRYEDTVADLAATARRTLDLLELPWDDAVLDYQRRAAKKQVLSPTYEAVTKPIYTSAIGRWRNYERYLAPMLPVLEPFVRAFGYDA
jgi:tetratricopeptide (TPR) repeat protein